MNDVKEEKLEYYQCLKLLEYLVEIGLIQKNPKIPSDILVFCEGNGEEYPEGWYSENIFDAARDLVNKPDDQRILLDAIEEKGFKKPELPKFETVRLDVEKFFSQYSNS